MKPSDSTWFKVRKLNPKWVFGIVTFLTVSGGGAWLASCAKNNGQEVVGYLAKPQIDKSLDIREARINAHRDSMDARFQDTIITLVQTIKEFMEFMPGGQIAAKKLDSAQHADGRGFFRHKKRYW